MPTPLPVNRSKEHKSKRSKLLTVKGLMAVLAVYVALGIFASKTTVGKYKSLASPL